MEIESILTTIKKMLGIEEDYTHFDVDIIVLINSSFMKLMQLGVGPKEGFRIKDKTSKWDDFLEKRVDIEGVKSYIYMDVRLIFDAPTPHYVAEAMKEQVVELGWRLNVQVEMYAPDPKEETQSIYIGNFTESDFNIKGWYTIPSSVHKVGRNAIVLAIDISNSDFSNVVCNYKILLNGDVRIISNVPFNGRIILKESK